ncbi:unnamed protein product [Gordionus sp. m RMFG-2023]
MSSSLKNLREILLENFSTKSGNNDTWDSQAVTHPSTNQAQRCLTSVFEREPVLSTDRHKYRVDIRTLKNKDMRELKLIDTFTGDILLNFVQWIPKYSKRRSQNQKIE